MYFFFFFSSRRRHTRSLCDWSSDVCSSDLDLPLGADVDARRRLVEEEDAGVGEKRAREGDQLALAERETPAALGHLGVVPVLELGDELVGADGARRGAHLLFARVRAAEQDVLADGAREKEALLRDDAELAPQ